MNSGAIDATEDVLSRPPVRSDGRVSPGGEGSVLQQPPSTGRIAAVILAAGMSSRMGTSKPLLPLGTGSVIERVIETARQAGVADLVVVTGYRVAEVRPVVERLGARHVHNSDYESGMFSSVRTGVGALAEDVGTLFILPVDCALVGPEVLRRLIRSRADAPDAILHPTCCGVRGHPPLISGRYLEELAQADATDDLRSFLERHRHAELDMDVQDLTILMDMDTPEDYERVRRFAEIMDAVATAAGAVALPALTADDALYLLGLLHLPDRVIRHSRTVAAVAVALVEALKPSLPALDVDLVRSGGLLHDMAKAERKHGAVGRALLENLGLRRLGSVVGSHMVMAPEQLDTSLPTEEQLVYLADKLVVEDQVTTLEERAARTLRKHAGDAAVAQGVEARLRASRLIARRVETIAGRSLEEIVGPVRREGGPYG